MSTDPIRLSSAPDAVAVIADPADPRHQGRQAYGDLRVGQPYLVAPEEAQRLLTAKGFALFGGADPKKGGKKADTTTTEPQE